MSYSKTDKIIVVALCLLFIGLIFSQYHITHHENTHAELCEYHGGKATVTIGILTGQTECADVKASVWPLLIQDSNNLETMEYLIDMIKFIWLSTIMMIYLLYLYK